MIYIFLDCASLGRIISKSGVVTWETLQDRSVGYETVQVDSCKCKVRVGSYLPENKVETGSIFKIVEQSEVVSIGPTTEAFTVCTVRIILVSMLVILTTSPRAGS